MEGRVGGQGDTGFGQNNTFIPCEMGKLPPAGLCPGYWPRVRLAHRHIGMETHRDTGTHTHTTAVTAAAAAAAAAAEC